MSSPIDALTSPPARRFARLHDLTTALGWVDRHARVWAAERIDHRLAYGRILAEDIRAPSDQPLYARAKVDGYALRGIETVGASTYNRLAFRMAGDQVPDGAADDAVLPGSARRVSVGSPLPEGADAVVPWDSAEEEGSAVAITAAIAPGENVQRPGSEVRQGAVMAAAGRRLGRFGWAAVAAAGIREVNVIRQPRVRIVAIGSELVPIGASHGSHQAVEVNSVALRQAVEEDGAEVESVCVIPDEEGALREQLLLPGADLILLAGASGQGPDDHAPTVLAEVGELALYGIALRQARTAGFGRIGSSVVMLLPGCPVACLCAYTLFASRAIRLMSGRGAEWPNRCKATIVKKIASRLGFADFYPVRFVEQGVEPLTAAASGSLCDSAGADGFILIPETCEGYAPGARITVNCYANEGADG